MARPSTCALTLISLLHHDELTEAEANLPTDTILWIHIFLQAAVWGVLFPIGMVLGISRSRWHVPLQVRSSFECWVLLTAGGYILGHSHGGRQFLPSAHGTFASLLFIPIAAQLVLGIYLKLHIHEGSIRPWAVRLHGVAELGQCLAHYIMGSGFIAYGVIMAIMLLVGRHGPEWWDSWVIMLWGIASRNTWSVKDMQHTILGVLWWAGGLLGILLARNNKVFILVVLLWRESNLILTGWAMSEHAQHLMISTKVHAMFGYTVMLAGLTRIMEVCFFSAPTKAADIVDDDDTSDHTLAEPSPGTPRGTSREKPLRTAAKSPPRRRSATCPLSVLFMSGTDEELKFVHDNEMDHVTYILIMFSIAFFLYALIVYVIHLYATTGRNAPAKEDSRNNIAMTPRNKWYSRVPNAESPGGPLHVIGRTRKNRRRR
ncbi:hypothetical protein B0H14DRAFT_3002964 [Mycena olivaceomarginata]|nr:hypothetical protein B0H14DRAFT_3002964 [Mycena olivaceomarginata]